MHVNFPLSVISIGSLSVILVGSYQENEKFQKKMRQKFLQNNFWKAVESFIR